MKVVKKNILLFFLIAISTSFSSAQDTISTKTDTVIRMHSPSRAALMSTILPGLGQIYNKKVWKVPVLYAGLSVNVYFLTHYGTLYRDYRKGYVDYQNYIGSLAGASPNPERVNTILSDVSEVLRYPDIPKALQFYKDQYRRLRDLNILILGGIYLINIIDATVDGYLFYYDIGDNLSLRVEPAWINAVAFPNTVGIKFTFNLY